MRSSLRLGMLASLVAACAKVTPIPPVPLPEPAGPPTAGTERSPAADAAPPSATHAGAPPTSTLTRMTRPATTVVPLADEYLHVGDRVALPDGDLFVGALGARWWSARATPGTLRGAPMVAPEELVAVRVRATGTCVFVGASGSTYIAPSPLADFEARRTPSVRFRAVAAGKDALVGITVDDLVVRSRDDGATWSVVALPRTVGMPLRVTMSADGAGIVESVPGPAWATFDDGATFAAVEHTMGLAPGPARVTPSGEIALEGSEIGGKTWEGGALLAHVALRLRQENGRPVLERLAHDPPKLALPVLERDGWLGLAEAVTLGRAVFRGDRIVEVPLSDSLFPAQPLLTTDGIPVRLPKNPAFARCTDAFLATAADTIVLDCVQGVSGYGAKHELFHSKDKGAHWVAEGRPPFHPVASKHRLWLGKTGTLLALGECIGPQRNDCLLAVRPPGGAFTQTKLPPEVSAITHVTFTPDGATIFAVGMYGEPLDAALLVSRDGGRSFSASRLPGMTFCNVTGGEGEIAELAYVEDTRSVVVLARAGRRGELRRFETRDLGRTFDTKAMPRDFGWVSLAGRHGLAMEEGAFGVAWETPDAGKTWGKVSLPADVAAGPLSCVGGACLVNGLLVRKGWQLESAADVPADVQPTPPRTTALSCSPAGAPLPWTIHQGTVVVDPTPTDAWMVAARDAKPPSGSYADDADWGLLRMPRGAAQATFTRLLPTMQERHSTFAKGTPEGLVVLRYPMSGPSTGLVDVEVAWLDVSTGRLHHAVLPLASPPVRWGDAASWDAWVAPGYGVYARPRVGKANRELFLARASGEVTLLDLPKGFPATVSAARRIGNASVFLGASRAQGGAASVLLVSTLPDGAPMSTSVWPIWPAAGEGPRVSFPVDPWIVVGTHGSVRAFEPEAPPLTFALPLSPGHEPSSPVRLPTLADLEKGTAGCTGGEGARVELPWTRETRHPIVLVEGKKTTLFATDMTVARVSPHGGAGACGGGITAELLDRHGGSGKLVLSPDGRAWHLAERASPLACVNEPGAARDLAFSKLTASHGLGARD